ncbi:MAG: DUF642 domain-containing protein [Candidatus Taylorbacteria bacterium]
MKKLILIGVVFIFVSVLTETFAQNLIQNGSFEFPVVDLQLRVDTGATWLSGWVVGGTGDVFIHNGPANGINQGPAQDGLNYLDLSGDGPPHAYVYQDLSTVPGLTYSLKFYTGSSGGVSPIINIQLQGMGILLNTNLAPLAPTAGKINWFEETFSFVSDANSVRLSFVDTSSSDDNASYVDNVSVSIIPEPTTLLPLGLVAMILWRRR